jgi:hypothetical protein
VRGCRLFVALASLTDATFGFGTGYGCPKVERRRRKLYLGLPCIP